MLSRALLLIVSVIAPLLVACSDGTGLEGDCNAHINFEGGDFRPVNALQTPLRGPELGSADYLACDGTVVSEYGKAQVFELAGEDPETVLIVPEDGIDVVYLSSEDRFRDRPQVLKDSVRFPKCKRPARFTATWAYIDPEDSPNMDDFAAAMPPYTAVVTTSRGRGLRFDRWSKMTLEIEVTHNTLPTPSPELLTAVNDGDSELVIRTQCLGTAFEATSIELAG